MNVRFLRIELFLGTIADIQSARLVICAVAARDQFFVFALEGEPSFEVVLLCGGVVEGAGDDGDDLVGETEGLVEFLGGFEHCVEGLPGVFWFGEEELFDLCRNISTNGK